MRLRIFIYVFVIFCHSDLFAQDFLLFQKNRHRQAKYYSGDVLKFYLKGENFPRTAQITGFQDSLIVFKNYRLHPNEISHLHLDDQTRSWFIVRYKYDRIFAVASVGYLLVEGINESEVTRQTGIISGALAGAGLLAHLVFKKRIKIKGRRKLMVVDI